MPLPTELVNAALLGTDQGSPPASLPAVDALLGKNADLSKEAKLLLAGAGIALRDEAGYVAPHLPVETIEPCPSDSAPVVSARTLRHLAEMVGGDHDDALPEWLRLIAAQGKRVPEEALPLLLEAGRKESAQRDLIAAVVGERGRWLARVASPPKEWNWLALPANLEKVWQDGSLAKRFELLETLRKQDPQAGRERLQKTWQQERAEERERLIFALWHGISAADEPFLEAALDDAAQRVRYIAQEMLATIPESRFYDRMVARGASIVTLKKEKKGASFKIEYKKTTDPSMERDGITVPNGAPDHDQPNLITAQILGHLRPEWWRAQFGLSTPEILEVAANTKTPLDLYLLLEKGAYRANDHEMLEAILPLSHNPDAGDSFVLLPAAAAERVLMQLLTATEDTGGKASLQNTSTLTRLIQASEFLWSPALTEALLARVAKILEGGKARPSPTLRAVLTHLAYHLPPELSDEIFKVLDVPTEFEKTWSEQMTTMRFTLEFRREMLAALHTN
jgi:hypothetical protein